MSQPTTPPANPEPKPPTSFSVVDPEHATRSASDATKTLQRWWLVLGFGSLVFLSILGLSQLPSWSREQRIEQYLPGHWQQTWQSLAAVNQQFGFDRSLVIMLQAPATQDVFSPNMMKLNQELTQKLSQLAGVQRVLSLSNGVTIRKQGDAMVVRPLMPSTLASYRAAQQKELRHLALADPLLRGSLISADGLATLVLITLHPALIPEISRTTPATAKTKQPDRTSKITLSQTVQDVLAVVHSLQPQVPLARWGVVGQPFVGPLLQKALLSQVPQVPILFVLWNLLLILLFIPGWSRKLWFVGISVCALFLAVASHTGWYGNIHLSVLWIPLWIWWIVGMWALFSPSSHQASPSVTGSPFPARTWLWFATALLASWGLSLWLHPWPMMQRWGITTTLTLLCILALVWFFAPPALPTPSFSPPTPPIRLSFLRSGLVGMVILLLGAGLGWLPLSISSLQHAYPRHSLLFHGEQISQQHFGGSAPFFIRFQGDLQDPVLLKAMERVGQRLEQLPGVSSVQSYGVIVRQLHAMLNQLPRIPDSRLKISSLAILLEGQPALASLVQNKNRDGIIQGRIQIKHPFQQHALLAGMQQALQGLPLRYQRVDPHNVAPTVRQQLYHQRIAWVAEGVSLWLKRYSTLTLSPSQQQELYKLLQRHLDDILRSDPTFVVEPLRLRQRVAKYLQGEDCDLELNPAEKQKVLVALRKANLQGQLFHPNFLQQTLSQQLVGSSALKDPQNLRYAVRSITNIALLLKQDQQITQLQQQLFRWLGTQRAWIQHVLPKIRNQGTEAARLQLAHLQGELLELHNPDWFRTDHGPQHLQVSHTGLHQFLLPLAKTTVDYGIHAAWILLLASFILCWLMFRSFATAWQIWLPIPITFFVLLGLMGWLDIPLDLSLIFLLLFLGGFVLFPSMYLYHAQQGTLSASVPALTHRQTLTRMALWVSLPATSLLLLPLPPLQHAGLLLTVGPWLALLACLPSHCRETYF